MICLLGRRRYWQHRQISRTGSSGPAEGIWPSDGLFMLVSTSSKTAQVCSAVRKWGQNWGQRGRRADFGRGRTPCTQRLRSSTPVRRGLAVSTRAQCLLRGRQSHAANAVPLPKQARGRSKADLTSKLVPAYLLCCFVPLEMCSKVLAFTVIRRTKTSTVYWPCRPLVKKR